MVNTWPVTSVSEPAEIVDPRPSEAKDDRAARMMPTDRQELAVARAWCGEPKTSAEANRHDALPYRMNMRTSRDRGQR